MSFSLTEPGARQVAEFISRHHVTDVGNWAESNGVSQPELMRMILRSEVHTVAIERDGVLDGVALLIESMQRLEMHNVCARVPKQGIGTALLEFTRAKAATFNKPTFWDTVSAKGFYENATGVRKLDANSFRLIQVPTELAPIRSFSDHGDNYFSIRLNGEMGRVYLTSDASPAIRIWVEGTEGNADSIQLALRLLGAHPLVAQAIRSGRRVYYPAPGIDLPADVWKREDVALFTFV
jgi:hypothetical protein